MSNVSSILTALKNTVQDQLGPSWTEIKYVYDVEKNDFRGNDSSFGVGVASGSSVSGTTKTITIDQEFFIILSKRFVNRSSDTKEREAISTLYDKMELIQDDIFQQKLGIPTIVWLVSELSYDAPENPSDGVVMLKGSFIIKHRKATN